MTVLDSLREQIAQTKTMSVAVAGGSRPLSTGCCELDHVLGGGLPRGRLVEVSGAWSSGKATLALTAAARLTTERRLAVYVDARGELYPPAAAALGVELLRLLVVRPDCARASGAARAGEIAARSGVFPLVILDLPDGEVIDAAAAGRLRAVAAGAGAVVMALASRPGALAQAQLKLETKAGVVTLRKGGTAAPGTRVPWHPTVDRTFAPAVTSDLGGLVLGLGLGRRRP
jgi:RecA/RadA recombinase